MHYHAEIWVKDLTDPNAAITAAMAPYRENFDTEEGKHGFWDWWQIGGRYTGAHADGYDPTTDPRNVKTCDLCNGTGFRTDRVGRQARASNPSYTCNGCGECGKDGKWTHGQRGPGKTVKWPTEWAPHLGDAIPVKNVSADLTAYTLIVGDTVQHMEIWNGKEWIDGPLKGKKVKAALDELGVTDGYLVTVDYHC